MQAYSFLKCLIVLKMCFSLTFTLSLQTFTLIPHNKTQLKKFMQLVDDNSFELMAPTPNVGIAAMVTPSINTMRVFGESFQYQYTEFSPHQTENLDKQYSDDTVLVLFDSKHPKKSYKSSAVTKSFSYRCAEEMQNCDSNLEDEAPPLVMPKITTETIGKSIENRDIEIIKIEDSYSKSKPIVLVVANLKGREFVGGSFGVHIANRLLESEKWTDLIAKYDWYFIIEPNPDGSERARKQLNDMLWDKNTNGNYSQNCPGVHLEFNFQTVQSPKHRHYCDRFYAGPYPFSEPETKAIRDVIERVKSKIEIYISLKTGQNYLTWLKNSSSSYNEHLVNFFEKAMTTMRLTPIDDAVRDSFGNELSYMKNEIGIPHVYLMAIFPDGHANHTKEFLKFELTLLGLVRILSWNSNDSQCQLPYSRRGGLCIFV